MSDVRNKRIRFKKLQRKHVRRFRAKEQRAQAENKPKIRITNHYLKHLLENKSG